MPASKTVPVTNPDRRAPSPMQKLRAFPLAVRTPALELLDEMSQPLTPRQIDRAFQDAGFARSDARRLTLALKGFNLIAVVPR